MSVKTTYHNPIKLTDLQLRQRRYASVLPAGLLPLFFGVSSMMLIGFHPIHKCDLPVFGSTSIDVTNVVAITLSQAPRIYRQVQNIAVI